jgi:DNA-binding NtrC family response regulator
LRGHSKKVLIIEDEILLAMNVQRDLESMGYNVVGIAESADAALDIISKEPPDIVLMDIVIQGHMNGIELTKVITQEYPQCKVIYMTAHSDADTVAKAKQTKYVGFLNKPFALNKFTQILDLII